MTVQLLLGVDLLAPEVGGDLAGPVAQLDVEGVCE